MNAQIRPARVADAGAIATVHVRSWQDTYQGLLPQDYLDGLSIAERAGRWRHRLAGITRPAADVLVVWRDAVTVGFAGFGPTRDANADPARTAEITTIYLLAEARGAGLGKRLMAAAVDKLAAAGYAEATLWVLAGNARARRFYAGAGWAADGTAKREEIGGRAVTEVRYRRRLPSPPI